MPIDVNINIHICIHIHTYIYTYTYIFNFFIQSQFFFLKSLSYFNKYFVIQKLENECKTLMHAGGVH